MAPDDVKEVVDLMNRLFEASWLDLQAALDTTADEVKVAVRGPDVGLLLGHNAELLDALEYLASRILTHQRDEETRLTFDANNYRARREKELRLMAAKAAENVRLSRRPFSFDPMSPVERRIIHLALSEDASVRTESQGTGENRKITVYPA